MIDTSRNPKTTKNHSRRVFGMKLGASAVALTYSAVGPAYAAPQTSQIQRFEQSVPFPVNAYIVEGPDGVVVVDSTLTNTSSMLLSSQVKATGKPLKAILLTHPHPDHYAGLHNLKGESNAEIVAIEGVNTVVRRDDAGKNELIGGMFGDEWPSKRIFPDRIVNEGESISFGSGLTFDVLDIGPAESLHDSVFIHQSDRPTAFVGDLVYSLMHPYMADNQNAKWLSAIDRLQAELDENMILYVGHGMPVTLGFMAWQKSYLALFETVVKQTDWSDKESATSEVVQEMQRYLPNEDLLFLMQLSIEPNARRLAVWK